MPARSLSVASASWLLVVALAHNHSSSLLNMHRAEHTSPDIVNRMVEDQLLDRAYAALADPTRRRLLEALREGDARITDLAAPMPMTFAGVSRHVGVLESAGLVRREVRRREHWLSLQPDGLAMAQQWMTEQTNFWSTRADALAARLRRKRQPR